MAALKYRLSQPDDAGAVAALHADSWRRNYRGAYADAFLDGDVLADRLTVWSERLSATGEDRQTTVVQDGAELVGFAHVVFEDDPRWGALLDNIHVAHSHKRRGLGSGLLARVAEAIADRPQPTGLYLWVLEQNTAGQAFYAACGARLGERMPVGPPGGVPSRLNGSPHKLRCIWEPPVLGTRG